MPLLMKMKKKTKIVSANLSDLAIVIYRNLDKIKSKGWFSQFVSEKLIDTYAKDFEKKALTELLHDKTKKRNDMDDEIKIIVKKIKKIK